MHTIFALLCFVVVIHWLIFPYPSGLLHWHCGNLTIAPVPAKQPWWIWISTSCEFIMNDCITTTNQSTTKPCAYFLGYTVHISCCRGCGLFSIFSIRINSPVCYVSIGYHIIYTLTSHNNGIMQLISIMWFCMVSAGMLGSFWYEARSLINLILPCSAMVCLSS